MYDDNCGSELKTFGKLLKWKSFEYCKKYIIYED